MADAIQTTFDELTKVIAGNPDLLKKINGIYLFEITTSKGEVQKWTVDLKNAPGKVSKSSDGKVDCTLTMKEQDFVDLMNGKITGQQAFMQSKLKIKGNMSYAMKLNELTKAKPKAKL
eukprot:TRINITY_DN3063_c0_g1_i1.p1 TRINITY_DN3063_c0_g1~~TRINITY_DN3063_c0_g1_i1.p1  ORF type:complete len:118 (-),score=26.76 TRINITY_DN3063_c0_g1_i1:298-651(-)